MHHFITKLQTSYFGPSWPKKVSSGHQFIIKLQKRCFGPLCPKKRQNKINLALPTPKKKIKKLNSFLLIEKIPHSFKLENLACYFLQHAT